jgi:hypothetical protein
MEFTPYPKTPRLKREVVITEKLDGTNAQVVISPFRSADALDPNIIAVRISENAEGGPLLVMRAGSRTRFITPGKTTDNYGFAAWCLLHADDLFSLGEGQHFGEWYGAGIQRTYGLDHKRFALFNTARWGAHNPSTPKCCEVVPLLGVVSLDRVNDVLWDLEFSGSKAVPGFMKPEGIIAYHSASKQNFKVLIENDHQPKGE